MTSDSGTTSGSASADVDRALQILQALDATVTDLLAQLAVAEEQRAAAHVALVDAVTAVMNAHRTLERRMHAHYEARLPTAEQRAPSSTEQPASSAAPPVPAPPVTRTPEPPATPGPPEGTAHRGARAPQGAPADPWLKRAVLLEHATAEAVHQLVSGFTPDECRLLELGGATPNQLRRLLPRGWCLQPDGDERTPAPSVLVYRSASQPPPMDVTLHRAYVLVDALALLDTTRKLPAALYAKLEGTLPQLRGLEPFHHRHVMARARWRRSAAVTADAIEEYVGRGAALGPLMVSEWLTVVASDCLQYGGTYAKVRAQLESIRTTRGATVPPQRRNTPSLSTAAPADARRSRPSPVLPTPAVPGLDLDVLIARRQSTEAARTALEDLTAPDDTVEEFPALERTTPTGDHDSLDAAQHELLRRLSACRQHRLDDVRQWARELDLVPLAALRALNQWAERRISDLDLDFDDAVVEVDDLAGDVWVDDIVEELLP